jgi:adenylate cyclase
MPSLFTGFEYDIFISYRHKDNKYDGWVSAFVTNLRKELEATFKEDISIYFDENSHDGLLENHDVDKSLGEKLKCLIFIPIISQTYCDPKSFAWKHEFCVFNKLAQEDPFGRDIKLANGNVASRILPVQIHTLDPQDKTLLENELGSILRPIEFIYNSKGVNRPLGASEDRPHDNSNKTYYRDQINKVANAVKQIIGAMGNKVNPSHDHKRAVSNKTPSPYRWRKAITWSAGLLILTSLGILGYMKSSPVRDDVSSVVNSIAVVPFTDLSENQDQEWFSDGMTEEVLSGLYRLKDWKIVSRTTAMKYKRTKLSATEIARELGVTHILEGSVRKAGNRIKISVQLIDASVDQPVWAESYERDFADVFAIQSDVARQIANILKVQVGTDGRHSIESRPVENTEAYTLYLQLTARWRVGKRNNEEDVAMLKKIIAMDPNFAPAYAKLGRIALLKGSVAGFLEAKDAINEGLGFLDKAVSLDPGHPDAHIYLAWYHLWYRWDFEAAGKEWQKVFELIPSDINPDIVSGYQSFLSSSGKFDEAFKFMSRMKEVIEPFQYWSQMSGCYLNMGQEQNALSALDSATKYSTGSDLWNSIYIKTCLKRYESALPHVKQWFAQFPDSRIPYILCYSAICYFKTGDVVTGEKLLAQMIELSKQGPVRSPSYHIAQVYSALGEKDQAFHWLNKALDTHEIEMYWLHIEPPLLPLHTDPRWSHLITKMKQLK